MSIINHVSVGSTKEMLPKMIKFYDAIAEALGAKRQMAFTHAFKDGLDAKPEDLQAAAYGKTHPEFWVQLPHDQSKEASPGNGFHLAFHCDSQAQVHAVYEAAMAHQGTDNGQPGPRPDYGEKYYAAFFVDPCGNKMEAIYLPE